MVEVKYNRNIAFNKVVQKTIVFGILISIVIGGTILLVVPVSQPEGLTVLEGPEVEGVFEQSFDNSSFIGSNHTRICDVTDFTKQPISDFTGSGDDIHVENQDSGFKVSGTNYVLRIEMYFSVLAEVYDNVTITIGLSDVHGAGIIRTIMDFDWTFFTYDENVTVIDGQSSDIVIHTSLVRPNEESQTWCYETKLIVEISQEQAGSVTVENLSIDIDSLSPIYPFQVQFLDQDQNIIYDAPGSKFMMYHPTLYITNDTYPHTDYYQRDPYMKGRTNNGTAYLPAGNYTFLFAWDDSWIYQISNLTSVLLQPNTAIRMNVTLSTTRIYFEIEPELEVRLRIENNARSVDIGPCIIPSDFYTYLPENASQIRMYLYPSYKRNSAFPSARYSYIVVWNEGPKDYTIQSSFPFFAFFLFGINGTQLLLVIIAIGAIIASLVSLHRLFDKQPFRNIFSHPEFISFALALVGILAPWLSWDIVKFDNGIRSYQFEWLINPIGVALEGGSDRLITSIPSEHLNVSTFHFVFWISLIAVGLRMMNVYYTETSLGFYAPYLVMGLSGVGAIVGHFSPVLISALFGAGAIGGTTKYELSIGPFFSIAALLVAFLIRADRWKRLMKGVWRKGD